VQHRDLLRGGQAAKQVIGPVSERESRIPVANRFDYDPSRTWSSWLAVITAGRMACRQITGKPDVSRLLRLSQCEI
jgi:hypothetical protein